MSDRKKTVFISHIHEDDALLPRMKSLIERHGMTVVDNSINSETPNNATSEAYIKSSILGPRIRAAEALVVLVNHGTVYSSWVNWEIEYAAKQGVRIVGVFAQGATTADLPESLEQLGDAAIVGWQGERIIAAIEGDLDSAWDDPTTSRPREPRWAIERHSC